MDKATLAALKGSIAKWESIAAGTGQDRGCLNCPLCKLFVLGRPFYERCDGCPVMEKTRVSGCRFTPYEEFDDLDSDHNNLGYAISDVAKEVARREVAFLKSLLLEEPLETPLHKES